MNEKMKKVGKKIGAGLLTLAIVLFFRHMVFKDSREEEQKSYYISTVSIYDSTLKKIHRKDEEIKQSKIDLKKEKKGTNEYNALLNNIDRVTTTIRFDTYSLQSYIREIRYYEEKFPELEPVKIENEKEILNGTYLNPEYYEKEK